MKLWNTKNILIVLCGIILNGCSNTEHTFSSLPARFHCSNVYQAFPLYNALNSMGEFCTINIDKAGKKYVFTGSDNQSSYVDITAIEQYSNNWVCLTGFIVGLPAIPEIGQDYSRVVCFELACSNCYENFNITKPLALEPGAFAHCKSCKRTYNLNNLGIVSKGETGRPLYRYRVSYTGSALIISNR